VVVGILDPERAFDARVDPVHEAERGDIPAARGHYGGIFQFITVAIEYRHGSLL
jgi:hypothetical protein